MANELCRKGILQKRGEKHQREDFVEIFGKENVCNVAHVADKIRESADIRSAGRCSCRNSWVRRRLPIRAKRASAYIHRITLCIHRMMAPAQLRSQLSTRIPRIKANHMAPRDTTTNRILEHSRS